MANYFHFKADDTSDGSIVSAWKRSGAPQDWLDDPDIQNIKVVDHAPFPKPGKEFLKSVTGDNVERITYQDRFNYVEFSHISNSTVFYVRCYLARQEYSCMSTLSLESVDTDIVMGLYSDADGPDALVAETDIVSMTTPEPGYVDVNFKNNFTPPESGFYWMAFNYSTSFSLPVSNKKVNNHIALDDNNFAFHPVVSTEGRAVSDGLAANPAFNVSAVKVPYLAVKPS